MVDDHVTRRRLLAAAGGVGTAGLGGCLGEDLDLGGVLGEDSSYVCTDLDDGPTERYDGEDNPFPFTFEVPTVMTQDEIQSREGWAEATFTKRWSKLNPGSGRDRLSHSLELIVKHVATDYEVRPVMFDGLDPRGRVLGKRRIDGEPVGLVERDASEGGVHLELMFPTTVDGTRVYRPTTVRIDAIIQGDQHEQTEAMSDDSEQTCLAAMRTVSVDVVDSVSAVSPAESETTLALTPSSASVQRGEQVEFTVEADGVERVDLAVDGDGEFGFLGTLVVGDAPVTLTVAPPTDERGANVVTTDRADRLSPLNSIGPFTAGTYTVLVRGAGTDGLVEASATLTVE